MTHIQPPFFRIWRLTRQIIARSPLALLQCLVLGNGVTLSYTSQKVKVHG